MFCASLCVYIYIIICLFLSLSLFACSRECVIMCLAVCASGFEGARTLHSPAGSVRLEGCAGFLTPVGRGKGFGFRVSGLGFRVEG